MRMWLRLGAASLGLVAASASAQTSRVIDEASFSFTRGGQPFGTETFKIIRRSGRDGPEFVTQATRTMEGRILRVSLSMDSAGTLTSYTRTVTGAGAGHLTARPAMNRLTVNEEGPQASSRDYAFAPGALILDGDVIHTLYFVTWQDPRELAFVDLSGRAAGRGSLTEVGRETLSLGSTGIPATRLEFGTGDAKLEIWVDSERRLLKVAHPARNVIGVRDGPPR
jgi:hypothetical protein